MINYLNTKENTSEVITREWDIMPYHQLLQELIKHSPIIPICEFKTFIITLPKHKLCELSKIISDIRKQKYTRTHETKYGNLPRCLNNIQLFTLFNAIDHIPTKRYLLIQFFYALRVSEVQTIEVLPEQRLLKINNQKCRRIDYIPIIHGTEKLFINLTETQAQDPNTIRNRFRRACEEANLNYVYCKDIKNYQRHQFSTHSLRHTGIQIFSSFVNGDLYKTCAYSRHNARHSMGTVATYRHYDLEEMRKDLNECFHNYTL